MYRYHPALVWAVMTSRSASFSAATPVKQTAPAQVSGGASDGQSPPVACSSQTVWGHGLVGSE